MVVEILLFEFMWYGVLYMVLGFFVMFLGVVVIDFLIELSFFVEVCSIVGFLVYLVGFFFRI